MYLVNLENSWPCAIEHVHNASKWWVLFLQMATKHLMSKFFSFKITSYAVYNTLRGATPSYKQTNRAILYMYTQPRIIMLIQDYCQKSMNQA